MELLLKEGWDQKGHPIDPVTFRCQLCGEATAIDFSKCGLTFSWSNIPKYNQRILTLLAMEVWRVSFRFPGVVWKIEIHQDSAVLWVKDDKEMVISGWMRWFPERMQYQAAAWRDSKSKAKMVLTISQMFGREAFEYAIESNNGSGGVCGTLMEVYDHDLVRRWAEVLLEAGGQSRKREEEKRKKSESWIKRLLAFS